MIARTYHLELRRQDSVPKVLTSTVTATLVSAFVLLKVLL